jgi:hypothetical protein
MRVPLIALLTAVVCFSAPASAQTPTGQETPEAAARTVLEATWRGDYLTAARATDPRNLRQTREMFDSLLRHGQALYIAQRLFELPDSQSVIALDDAAFTAGLFRFQWMLRGFDQYMKSVTGVDIQGVVHRGADSAHVVYRHMFPPDSLPLQSFQVQTVVRCGSLWCANMLEPFHAILRLLKGPMVPVRQ